MQSYYQINVAQNGRHLFATGPNSCWDEASARKAFNEIVRRFPASEGFEVSVTLWEGRGYVQAWV
jgi:hypothetical protein